MHRIPFLATLAALTALISLLAVGNAGAVVLNDTNLSPPTLFGAALVPGTNLSGIGDGVSVVTSNGSCTDPWLSSDLTLPADGLCYHGGPVMHGNETFALTWDPVRRYFSGTRDYVEQFLRDVADGSGTLTSPYAVTGQYADGIADTKDPSNSTGRAENASIYGGGCIDYGNPGGFTCNFADTNGSGMGQNYPATNTCPVSGTNQYVEQLDGSFVPGPNDICITDADVRGEVAAMVPQLRGQFTSGYWPTVVVLTPPGVEVCLDSTGADCSANSNSAVGFCSYHSHIVTDGVDVAYVVQPWTAGWTSSTGCDDLGVPAIPSPFTAAQLDTGVGARLVSPLSQSQIAAIVDPDLNGWSALDGSEVDDNGCVPLPASLDTTTVGSSAQNPYFLQREFNNAGVIETDPIAPSCTGQVILQPAFVVPSTVDVGDVVQFDGSTTESTLIVPKENYAWSFGDGSGQSAVGPSVEHGFTKAGTYTVTLTVTDRGGNTAKLTQPITVLGPAGKPVSTKPSTPKLTVRVQLMPRGLKRMLRHGLAMELYSSLPAAGTATISIPRAAARRAHIRTKRGSAVTIGRGTITGVAQGMTSLDIHIARATAHKLGRLHRVTMTIRVTLVDAAGSRVRVDVAGRY